MKKYFSLLTVLCLAITATAQVNVDDFENSSNAWNNVSCGSGIIDNPYQEGLNLSCQCLQIVRASGCDNWSGAIYTLPQAVTGYKYVHALMYRNNSHNPNLKVTDNGSNLDMTPMNAIVANRWQDVVFDISDKAQADFVMFMADRDELTEDAVVLIDDVIFSNDATPRTTPNTACGNTNPDPVLTDEYTLVWNEDFTEESLDLNAWNIETNGDGGGNNELQYYCDRGVKLGVEPTTGKHCLVLTATKESFGGKTCTSGRVNSLGRVYFQYGKVEARIWFPNTANGLWPAFWMMGNDFSSVGWPACGETDIIELGHSNGFGGIQDRYFNGASHWGPRWDQHYQYANSITNSYSVEDGFHTFTCIWSPEKVAMYVDLDKYPTASPYYEMSIPVSTEDNAPGKYFHKPNFIIFNLAVGGNFPGIYDINGITALANGPRSMYIDWVRVYQRDEAGCSFTSAVTSDPIEGGTTENLTPTLSPKEGEKVLINGQLLIRRGEHVYDVTGRIIR
ncbi:MAG: glycoside hydrolase family 16 protein [Paludibacteraceae bacterium]|nr:glycoside hydrolase family 16 protein [Paludibacteraceae bacterium]